MTAGSYNVTSREYQMSLSTMIDKIDENIVFRATEK